MSGGQRERYRDRDRDRERQRDTLVGENSRSGRFKKRMEEAERAPHVTCYS